jgi:Amt family ammonium transporter
MKLDSQTFAGSGVVHLCGAVAALAGVLVLGSRKGKYSDGKVNAMPGANLPLATLGTFILWLGWFGFNGGSELIISNVAEANAVSMVFVNTNLAAAGGVMGALILSKLMFGKSDLTMALNGAIGGLVSITAEPLAPTPGLALIIGAIGGLIVVMSIVMLDKMKIDDPCWSNLCSRNMWNMGTFSSHINRWFIRRTGLWCIDDFPMDIS